MRTSDLGRRAIAAFDAAPMLDRAHVRARWWTCPLPPIERHVPPAGRILEVGCGHGLLSIYLALAEPRRLVEGIDIDARKIGIARQAATALGPEAATVSFAHGRAGVVPEGPFDAIVVSDVLYLLSADARADLLAACADHLAPHGVMVVKELDTTPAWKYRIGRAQEVVATRVLRYTQGSSLVFTPMAAIADELEQLGFRSTLHRADRGYVHPHGLLVARRPRVEAPAARR